MKATVRIVRTQWQDVRLDVSEDETAAEISNKAVDNANEDDWQDNPAGVRHIQITKDD